jgi:tetratricopeptide (TPR) repeat protein
MLARPLARAQDRAGRLFRLAQLELEVAILRGASGAGSAADLEACVVTCRRILAETPVGPLVDRVRLFLARVELRRGQARAALDALGALPGATASRPLVCQARALAGEALHRRGDHARAARAYRELLGSRCGAGALGRTARYKLAWTLMAAKKPRLAAAELTLLSRNPGLRGTPLQGRVFKDLVLAWSLCAPVPRGAVALLLRHDGAQAELVTALARRLLETGKVAEMLDVTSRYFAAARRPAAATVDALRELRIQGLARTGTTASFAAELAAQTPKLGLASSRLREAVAKATLQRALQAQPGGKERKALMTRLAASTALSRTAAGAEARYHLGLIKQQAGDHLGAARHFEAAVAALPAGELRWRARYRLVSTLEQRLSAAPSGHAGSRRKLVRRFVLAAQRFIRAASGPGPDKQLVPQVQLVLAARLFSDGSADTDVELGLRILDRYLGAHPRWEQRQAALNLSVAALQRAARWKRLYHLAQRELRGACKMAKAACQPLARAAAAAALRVSQGHVNGGRWAEAHVWMERSIGANAANAATKGGAAVFLAAANLAARAGRPTRGLRHHDAALAAARGRGERLAVLSAQAELLEALGRLKAAAAVHLKAVRDPDIAATAGLARLHLAARDRALAGDRPGALALALRLRRRLYRETIPPRAHARYQLQVGAILERAGGRAREHYVRQAHGMMRHHPQAAASCLVRAAVISARSSSGRRRARRRLEQAIQLAGAPRAGGVTDEAPPAVAARLELARLVRVSAAGAAPRSARAATQRVVRLQEQIAPLVQVIRLGLPRWSSAAGAGLASIYGALARTLRSAPHPADLTAEERRDYRRALERQAAALDEQRGQLLRHLKPASGAEIAALTQQQLPKVGHEAAPVRALIVARRFDAARYVATRALKVYGQRADLLCGRGLAAGALGDEHGGAQDLDAARRLDPSYTCGAADSPGSAQRLAVQSSSAGARP